MATTLTPVSSLPGTTAKVNPGAGAPSGLLAGNDAQAALQQWLDSVNLGSLTTWAWQQLTTGATPNEIEQNLRATPQWQQEYGGSIVARQKAGLPPISEQDVINYRDTAQQLAQEYNLPPGFLSNSLIDRYIAADKSTAELEQEIHAGYSEVQSADPTVQAYFRQTFGVGKGDGALAAYFMDPNASMPALLQQAQAAQIGGAGVRAGITLTGAQSMGLAQSGVTADRAQSGFADIDKLAPLFNRQVGDTGPGLDKAAAAVGNIVGNAQTADQLEQALNAHVALAQGKVGVEENPQKGFEGLGSGF